jgi:MFS family permease
MAIALVTTLGYLGFLTGPPLIGFLAELVGLRYALGVIVAKSLVTVALASTVKEQRKPSLRGVTGLPHLTSG